MERFGAKEGQAIVSYINVFVTKEPISSNSLLKVIRSYMSPCLTFQHRNSYGLESLHGPVSAAENIFFASSSRLRR